MPEPAVPDLPSGRRWVWDVASFTFFTAPAVVAPVLPLVVEDDLRAGSVAIGAAVAAIGLPGIVSRPVAGRAADRFGARRLFLAAALLAGAGIAGSGLAAAGGLVVAFVLLRLVQGIGDGAVFTASATDAGHSVAPARRGRAFTRFALTLTAGLVIGPVVSEVVVQAWGRSAVFWVGGGLSVLAAVLLAVGVRPERLERSPSPPGRRGGFVHLPAVVPGVALGLANLGFSALYGFVVLVALDRGMARAGLLLAVFAATLTLVRGLGGRVPDRIGLPATIAGSAVLSASGMFGLAVAPSTPSLVAATVCFGVGSSLLMPAVLAEASGAFPDAGGGVVLGTVSGLLDVILGAGALLLGVVAAVAGVAAPFVVCGVAALVSLPIFAAWRTSYRRALASGAGAGARAGLGVEAA